MKGMRIALGALLACSLVPVPAGAAWADEPTAGDGSGAAGEATAALPALEPGTYVEHEAVAYVMDGGALPLSADGGVLDGAQPLMDVDADAAAEAFDGAADAKEPQASATARSLAASDGGGATAGRLVLVRDEAKTTEQLIAELEADPRVVFAEPNAVVETGDADSGAQAAQDAAIAQLAEEAIEGLQEESGAPTAGVDGAGGLESANGGEGGGAAAGDDDAHGAGSASGEGSAGDVEGAVDGTSEGADGEDAEGDADGADGDGDDATDVVFGEDDDGPAADLDDFVWGFRNDGRMGGISADEAVDMGYAAWPDASAAGGLDEVVVAVIDSGVDASNPDLAPVMWNEGLTSGIAPTGKEDEHGFAAAADATAGVTSTTGISSYHGTHVAGTIGAAWDGEGVSGLAPNARIMAVRHNDTLAGMLECFDYVSRARDAGVDVRVTNNSWGFGQGMWRSIDVAVTQVGRQGVVSVFASGNSAFDNDAAASTATTLADNPYAIVVNALDPTGEATAFTQYGETATDVMAPGSTALSTYATGEANAARVTDGPIYLGEEDADAVLYESFDAKTRMDEGVASASGEPVLSFLSEGEGQAGEPVGEVVTGGKRFDGEAAYELPYVPPASENPLMSVVSSEVDLSGVAEKPTHASIRYTADFEGGVSGIAQAVAAVPVIDEGGGSAWAPLTAQAGSSFGLGGDSWNGLSVELPEDTDWSHFRIKIFYALLEFSMTGGVQAVGGPAAGTLVIDSIGLGSDLVPYAYMQGTSMACPAVAGAATVIAGQGLADVADDEAKSAEKLAALAKGAAEPDARYGSLCSTGGYATVDGAQNPGPAIMAVRDANDAVEVEGYFMPEGATVRLGDAEAAVVGREDLGGDKARLTVRKPEGFSGGQTVVRVEANGKLTSHRADLGARADATYYDQTNLPVPEELTQWGSWQLVGFDGDIYCLPRTSTLGAEPDPFDHLLRYRPDAQEWEQVPLPTDAVGAASPQNLVDVSGATLDGALVLQLGYASGAVRFVRYTADGAWEAMGYGYALNGPDKPLFGTLASDGEELYLFGGAVLANGAAVDSSAVYRIDLEAAPDAAPEKCGELSTGRIRPQVAYGNGAFAVSGGVSLSYQLGGVAGVEMVTPSEGGYDWDTGEELPTGWLAGGPVDTTALVTETGQMAWASGALADGFALVGPESDDGASDTYLLDVEGAFAPTAYEKRASWQKLLAPAATAYRGQLYVLASAQNEPYRVFSATAMETVEQPGDVPAVPDPEYASAEAVKQLEDAIKDARNDLTQTVVSADGADVAKGTPWVTRAAYDAFEAAIAAAEAAVGVERPLASDIERAAADLAAAREAFDAAKADGLKAGGGSEEKPGAGSDAKGDGSALQKLASTGDALAWAPLALGSLVSAAGATLVVTTLRRRSSSEK
ncbi:S8 family serine peptidase [Gordonibacter sp. An230]|uniref:S8 family serine peptidase n=1 Tax=Gordonibacter sp. An230 TaxID=1965592 RepID=UPI0013A6466B|nr:S8 family serine peptidase [Gordonibacter sp. An230]